MTPRREQKYQRSYAHELLRISMQDFEAAGILARHSPGRVENVFLLAQQSLEKALKAVLCWQNISVPFTHDLAVLIERLSGQVRVPFEGKFDSLSEYATIRRYMEGHEETSSEDVQEILAELKLALDWCQSQVT